MFHRNGERVDFNETKFIEKQYIQLAKEQFCQIMLVQKMKEKLQEKFASINHAGPADIVSFLGITDEDEIARVKQDSYQKVHFLVNKLDH